MRKAGSQFTLGSLMALIGTVALLLSVPKASWVALWVWLPNLLAMFVLSVVGFGLGYIGSRAATVFGRSNDTSSIKGRPSTVERRLDRPTARTQ